MAVHLQSIVEAVVGGTSALSTKAAPAVTPLRPTAAAAAVPTRGEDEHTVRVVARVEQVAQVALERVWRPELVAELRQEVDVAKAHLLRLAGSIIRVEFARVQKAKQCAEHRDVDPLRLDVHPNLRPIPGNSFEHFLRKKRQ